MTLTVIKAAVSEQDTNGDFVEVSPSLSIDYEVEEKDLQPVKKSGFSSGIEIDDKGILIHKWLLWFDRIQTDVCEKDIVEIDGMKYVVSGIDRFRRHKEVLLHGME